MKKQKNKTQVLPPLSDLNDPLYAESFILYITQDDNIKKDDKRRTNQ